MERRILPALPDHMGREGAVATRWEGWINPRNRSLGDVLRINASHPARAEELDEFMGCYSILYCSGGDSLWAAYIGYSARVASELRRRIRDFEAFGAHTARFRVTALYIPKSSIARAYEDDMIRFYAPPWNVRFWKQSARQG